MVTDSRGYLSRPAAEAGRLALRTGRLASADPDWTPARRPSHAVRDLASLAPGPAELAELAGGTHYVTDSLAQAHRSGQVRPQPDVEVAPQPEAAGAPARVAPSAEAAAAEPEMDGGPEISPG
jgi:hypothetical protein